MRNSRLKESDEKQEELLTGYLGSFMVLESCSKAIDVSCVWVNNGFFGIITTVENNSEHAGDQLWIEYQFLKETNEEKKTKEFITFPGMIQETHNETQ